MYHACPSCCGPHTRSVALDESISCRVRRLLCAAWLAMSTLLAPNVARSVGTGTVSQETAGMLQAALPEVSFLR